MDAAPLFWDVATGDGTLDMAGRAKDSIPILVEPKRGDGLAQGGDGAPLFMGTPVHELYGAKRKNHGTKDSHVVPHHGTD